MKQICSMCAVLAFSFIFFGRSPAWAGFPFPPALLTWDTILTRGDSISVPGPLGPTVTVGNMEGLTGPDSGILYVADRGVLDGGMADPGNTDTCHVWRIDLSTRLVNLVGRITADPCRPSGLALGPD